MRMWIKGNLVFLKIFVFNHEGHKGFTQEHKATSRFGSSLRTWTNFLSQSQLIAKGAKVSRSSTNQTYKITLVQASH
jgi:hypothetical protein